MSSYVYTYGTDEDYSPQAVNQAKQLVVTDKGQKQKYYLFKVTYNTSDAPEHYLGVAGPFSIDSKKVTSDNEATGIYWKENFKASEIDYLFGEYRKEIEANKQ